MGNCLATLTFCLFIFCPGSHKNGVKHYHIKRVEGKYYVTERHRFDTIPELIEYHKHNAGGEAFLIYLYY